MYSVASSSVTLTNLIVAFAYSCIIFWYSFKFTILNIRSTPLSIFSFLLVTGYWLRCKLYSTHFTRYGAWLVWGGISVYRGSFLLYYLYIQAMTNEKEKISFQLCKVYAYSISFLFSCIQNREIISILIRLLLTTLAGFTLLPDLLKIILKYICHDAFVCMYK